MKTLAEKNRDEAFWRVLLELKEMRAKIDATIVYLEREKAMNKFAADYEKLRDRPELPSGITGGFAQPSGDNI